MKTTVMKRGEAQFDMVGRFLGYPLKELNEEVSQGLAKRLVRYAEQRLDEAGFLSAVTGWSVEVYTLDGDDTPADRGYCVKFQNEKGGYIEVIGILTRKGWPTLDHGLTINQD